MRKDLICTKLPMSVDGIIRLAHIEIYPEYLEKYLKYANEVGETSLRSEPGVLTMYAVSQKDNPCKITILESYANQEAYKTHVASKHFQEYKQNTLHMIKSLELVDQLPLNQKNKLNNFIE